MYVERFLKIKDTLYIVREITIICGCMDTDTLDPEFQTSPKIVIISFGKI
jgi:hypothetical protein